MARELESYDFKSNSGRRVRSYQGKYDWDKWFGTPGNIFQGKIWELLREEHFPEVSISSFRQAARNAAGRRHVRIRTSQKDEHTAIILVEGPEET